MWAREAGKGGRWGGAPESSVGATRRSLVPLLGSLKNLTIGLIWLVTRGGGVGGVGQGGGQGGRHQRQCGSNTLKNLTIGLIWLVTRGEAWGVWAREAGKGG